MADEDANGVIVAAQTDLVTLGAAPSQAMAMTYQAMAGSIGVAMENAVANQQQGQIISTAALVKVVAMILSKGG